MSFENKVVLITGAAGGIGIGAAKAFAKKRAKLVLVDLNMNVLEQASTDIETTDILLLASNVAKEEEVKKYVDDTMAKFGRIDVLINNAGTNGQFSNIVDQSEENLRRVMDVNFFGAYYALKYVLRVMKEQGSGVVVNTASTGGLHGSPGMSVYVSSKHALIGLNKSAAYEMAPFGIRVNAVCPSGVDTEMMKSIEENTIGGHREEARKQFESRIPMKRYAKAEEIADLMVFLASDKASFISGSYYRIDGGQGAQSV